MGETHKSEVVFGPVGRVLVEVRNLPELLCQVATEVKTEGAASAAVGKHRSFDVYRGPFSARILGGHSVCPDDFTTASRPPDRTATAREFLIAESMTTSIAFCPNRALKNRQN
ncbi:MAG TPA: hypothetical protein VMI94_24800 [Bryobacteraceae bacterium]|nr:hypothetical protein [Bryobacteraceae bacterium]